jgi:hypothetical protein
MTCCFLELEWITSGEVDRRDDGWSWTCLFGGGRLMLIKAFDVLLVTQNVLAMMGFVSGTSVKYHLSL